MSTCFICCPTPKPARVCTFSSRINPDGRNSNENRRRSPLLSLRTYKFPLYPFPTLPSLFIFLFPFLLFPSLSFSLSFLVLICQLHRNTRGRLVFEGGEGTKDGRVEEYDRGRSHLKYKWTMGEREKRKQGIHLRRLCRRCELFA